MKMNVKTLQNKINEMERIVDFIKTLEQVNYQIAELKRMKEEIESIIIKTLDHNLEGSKTYEVEKYAVTVKTEMIYTLDKENYLLLRDTLNPKFDPVVERVRYDVNKKVMRDAQEYASQDDLLLLAECISKKPAKPNVKIGAAI